MDHWLQRHVLERAPTNPILNPVLIRRHRDIAEVRLDRDCLNPVFEMPRQLFSEGIFKLDQRIEEQLTLLASHLLRAPIVNIDQTRVVN